MKRSSVFIALLIGVLTMACGDLGDSDLETEVGEEPNNGPGPIEGFSEERDIAVGAKHLVTPTEGTRISVAIPSDPDIVNVPDDVGDGGALEIKCVTPGTATIDINLESTSSSQTVAGEFVANCLEAENLVLSPLGFEVLGRTQRMPYRQRIVAASTEPRVRYDVFAQDNKLAGYAYDPFSFSEGLEYTSRPENRVAAESSSGRFIDFTIDQGFEGPTVETVLGRTLPVDVITPDSVEEVIFTDISGRPVDTESEDFSSALVQVEGLSQNEPVYGLEFNMSSQTPDICEVTTMDEITEEEADVTLPVFSVTDVAPGTCEVRAEVVDGGGIAGTLTFEVTQ